MARHRRAKGKAKHVIPHDNLLILLIDIDGLVATHALSAAKTLSALTGSPDYEARRLDRPRTIQEAMRRGHKLCFYIIHEEAVICRLAFRIAEGIAHVDNVDCYAYHGRVVPLAYTLFHRLVRLLRLARVEYIHVTVAERRTQRFYLSLGFVEGDDGVFVGRTAEIASRLEAVFT